MKIINISVNSADPKTMIEPVRDVTERFGLDAELLCFESSELDNDLVKYR